MRRSELEARMKTKREDPEEKEEEPGPAKDHTPDGSSSRREWFRGRLPETTAIAKVSALEA